MFPILREKLKAEARDLSGGQQQMLALAQAFVAQPKVLLCDEPSLGIALALIPPILEFLRRWAAHGTAWSSSSSRSTSRLPSRIAR